MELPEFRDRLPELLSLSSDASDERTAQPPTDVGCIRIAQDGSATREAFWQRPAVMTAAVAGCSGIVLLLLVLALSSLQD